MRGAGPFTDSVPKSGQAAVIGKCVDRRRCSAQLTLSKFPSILPFPSYRHSKLPVATNIRLDNFKERDETVLSASPALELGTQFSLSNGTFVRPYVRGGATFFDDPDFEVPASFESAPSSLAPFRTKGETDDVVANVSAGIDLLATGR